MSMNIAHTIVGTPTNTGGATPTQILPPQGSKVFKNVVLFNPAGSGAGEWSDNGFKTAFPFAAGPSATHMFDHGMLGLGVQVRRTTPTNVSGAVVFGF